MAAYTSAWFIYAYVVDFQVKRTTLLSNWTEGLMVTYFLYAFFISIHAVVNRKRDITENEGTSSSLSNKQVYSLCLKNRFKLLFRISQLYMLYSLLWLMNKPENDDFAVITTEN